MEDTSSMKRCEDTPREPTSTRERSAPTGRRAVAEVPSDPVRVYLGNMADLSLIDRDEEVALARQMEDGRRQMLAAALRAPNTARELVHLGRLLERGSIGLGEVLAGDGVTVVEWGERLAGHHRRDAIVIRLYDIGEGARRIELRSRVERDAIDRDDA